MQYVNDDMDDVFKRAGKEYPLNANSGDWNKVAAGLAQDNPDLPVAKKNNRKYLLLLLLLPFSWICNKYISGDGFENENAVAVNGKEKPSAISGKKSVLPATLHKISAETIQTKEENANDLSVTDLLAKKGSKESSLTTNATKNSSDKRSIINGEQNSFDAVTKRNSDDNENFRAPAKTELIEVEFPWDIDFNLQAIHISAPVNTVRSQSSSLVKTTDKKIKKFYVGVVGGIDATTIKFQKLMDHGFNAGLIAGFDLTKHVSVEAGVFSTQKNYYTEGDYFSTSKMYIPANTKITSVDGNCRMIELPVVMRYNFNTSKKAGWFATAGVSNFIMKKENYNYVYLYTNTGTSVVRSKAYENSSKNWLAAAQLSGGISYPVKNSVNLRIEPYLQIPLKGVGVGAVALTSAGLRLGITKKLF